MSELELALIDLGRRVEFPPTPDLAPGVRARLAERPAPAQGLPFFSAHRRMLAIALAVLVVAVAAVMAVPQTRAAILEFFHLRGVTIERVGTLPTVPVRNELGPLGERVSLDQARERADFDVVVPEALGEPDEVYFWDGNPPGGMVSFVWGSREEPRAFLSEFRASVKDVIFKKAAANTRIEHVTIDGDDGYFLSGSPHQFSYFDRYGQYREELVRLVGNTLVWERGTLTLRLEADINRAEAVEIARSVH
jgi:hypothetical protein